MSKRDHPRRRRQRIREAEERFGPDHSEIVHTFADAWTIRRPRSIADVAREGILLDNCLRDVRETLIERGVFSEDQDPAAFEFDDVVEPELAHLHSLRDSENHPRAIFAHMYPLGSWGVTGKGNTPLKAEYLERIQAWHDTLPYPTTLEQLYITECRLLPTSREWSLAAA